MINVLKKAMNKTADPEIGELTNYSLTYGTCTNFNFILQRLIFYCLTDFIVPTAIIATLIVGNLIILAAVIHCRRRSKYEIERNSMRVRVKW